MTNVNIAIVGASGAVGKEILIVLNEYKFKINNLLLLASKKSLGESVNFRNKEYKIQELKEDSFEKNQIDIAFFSAGASVSAKFAHLAASNGALVIDNTSHFRMNENVPLVVPEVNGKDVDNYAKTNIIANPNCSTIQMVHILKPLDDLYKIKSVNVSTYQAVSGAGLKGANELFNQMKDISQNTLISKNETFSHQIALNVIPNIDKPMKSGFTKEEEKMIYETRKILHSLIKISPTCVRIPVLRSHSESISISFTPTTTVDISKVKKALSNLEHIKVLDDLENNVYPMPLISTNTNTTFVGRIRRDVFDENILHLFVCADQLKVGAATNAVKIAILWVKKHYKNK